MCVMWVGVKKAGDGRGKEGRDIIFSVAYSYRTGGNGHELKDRKFCLNIRRNFFTVKIVKQWNRLSRKLYAWRYSKPGLCFVLGNEIYSNSTRENK